MATYTHDFAKAPVQRTPLSAGQPVTGHARYTLGPNLAVGDVVQLFRIAQGARIRNWMVFAQKVDTGGTPAFAFNLGDTGSATRFASASTVGQAGGTVECAVGAAPKGYTYLNDDMVILTVTAAAASQAAGTYIDVYVDLYQG